MAAHALKPHGRTVLMQPRLDAGDVLEGGPGVLAANLDVALRDERAPGVSGLRVAHQAEVRRAVRRKHRSVAERAGADGVGAGARSGGRRRAAPKRRAVRG